MNEVLKLAVNWCNQYGGTTCKGGGGGGAPKAPKPIVEKAPKPEKAAKGQKAVKADKVHKPEKAAKTAKPAKSSAPSMSARDEVKSLSAAGVAGSFGKGEFGQQTMKFDMSHEDFAAKLEGVKSRLGKLKVAELKDVAKDNGVFGTTGKKGTIDAIVSAMKIRRGTKGRAYV